MLETEFMVISIVLFLKRYNQNYNIIEMENRLLKKNMNHIYLVQHVIAWIVLENIYQFLFLRLMTGL